MYILEESVIFFNSFTMQDPKGSVENRGRSPRFSILPTVRVW